MTMTADPKTDEIRGRILAAARRRFDRYGFGKTTMAEIAGDCGMSAANLYRFFASKSEIGAGIAAAWFAETEGRMRALVARADGPPAAKLQALVLFKIDLIAELIAESPHIDELVDHVCRERLDLIEAHRHACNEIVAAILEEGNRAGVFAVDDCLGTAAIFHAATVKFYYPDFVRVCDRDLLSQEARQVVALLITGIAKR